ncbi:MAG: P-loop NTPase [Actinobacteria bacterium]|nr:P-loop NTPase [Actinomycetota bacterium]MBU4450329.1 P-loop NTPase [Actinomycetota bacterium]MCG2788569.1 P-loop NTPase [Actinomycetes bacterium]
MKKIPIGIIDKDENNIQKVVALLKNVQNIDSIKFSTNIRDIEMLLIKKKPILVLIGPTYKLDDFEEFLISQSQALNLVKIILLTSEVSTELLKRALKLNIHDVLEFPFDNKDFKESIERAEVVFEAESENVSNVTRFSKKIMFFSTKGGSGNTFIAINFALALRKRTKKEVILFDANYQLGDIALMLGLYPRNTIFDLMTVNKYDPETLNIFLTTHKSGIKVLPSPTDPSQCETIGSEVSIKVLEELSKVGDYIVIDAPFGFSDVVLSFLENIDHLFIVSTKDLPSIKNLKICLQVLDKLKFNKEKLTVILNRADSKVDIEIDEIEKTINRKIESKIPSDRIVPVSINKGTPAFISFPRSAVSNNIYKLTDILLSNKEYTTGLEKIIT